jgi:hypothetical protein
MSVQLKILKKIKNKKFVSSPLLPHQATTADSHARRWRTQGGASAGLAHVGVAGRHGADDLMAARG